MRPTITLDYLRPSTQHFQESFIPLLFNQGKETQKRHKNLIKFISPSFFSTNLMKTRVAFLPTSSSF